MSIENFNLHIAVPEDDNSSDPELIRLRAELMAIKPLLDDAIQRKSVSEAEDLYKQALEAKTKLESYKESLNKKEEYKTIEINGTKIELGPELGEMTWNGIPTRLEEFNKTLKPGEKPWRVLTREEFEEIGKPIREILHNQSLEYEEKEANIKHRVESLGFTWNTHYWSGSEYKKDRRDAWFWNSYDCGLNKYYKYAEALVRLAR